MPERHPDDDVLADLAADVLPAHEARSVESHVLSCDRCALLLEDAERVRGLLLSDDPGPVPVDVWRRIEAALAAEATASGGDGHATGTDRTADTAAFRAFVDAPAPAAEAADEAGPGWSDDADPLDDPVRWGAVRTPRARRGGGSTRREAREPVHARRRGPILLGAAAAVAVVAVVGAVRLGGNNTSGAATLSAGSDASSPSRAGAPEGATPSAAATAPVVRSGQAYSARTLAGKAAGLIGADVTTTSRGAASPGGAVQAPAPPAGSDAGAATVKGTRVPANPKADDVTNPTRLAACLDALGVARDTLVAVDLATYEGREAAILVLVPPEGGGHEVWAVERTCARGAEGALKYTHLSD